MLSSGLGGAGGWLAAAGAPTRATAGSADDAHATLEVTNPDVLISFREYARIAGRNGKGAVAGGCPPAASGS